MLQSLLPIKLKKEDPSYQTVEELADVLQNAIKNEDIRNIALTGPFGSGKSSVLYTLMEDYSEFRFLPISLATLQADNEGNEVAEKRLSEKEVENLNRKIEYSILQQIIYKEKDEKVPNSRFRRIIHIDDDRRGYLALNTIFFVLSFITIFFKDFSETVLRNLHIYEPRFVTLLYVLSIGYLMWGLYSIIRYFVRVYANSKLNKFNLKDGEIEVVENNSIFNKHLDEILYFFQVTDYNVVVIEDLDRFETETIYLKLRELNQLINESKIVDRHVVFIYAIKDDVFEDEARTKFFDYIITIIPIINSSNSKYKLKEALRERGFAEDEISDDDLSEIAFFIQDMRILTNIANEFHQYRKLHDMYDKHLNMTKLLAMMVYKNYYPRDFALLHRREGKVYNCISKKPEFVKEALKGLENQVKELEEARKLFEKDAHLKENDLRLLFLYDVVDMIPNIVQTIEINNNEYKLKQISQEVTLFNHLLSQNRIVYYYKDHYGQQYRDSIELHWDDIVKDKQLNERIEVINKPKENFDIKENELRIEELNIQALKLSDLIRKYDLGENTLYKELDLTPLMDVFVRRGYLDENFYDYISYYFSSGMLSQADWELLLSIKRQIKQKYTYHIDNIDNFVKELRDYMFEHVAILNNELLDYLAKKKNGKGQVYFTQIMTLLKKPNAPLDFLAQYYQWGKQKEKVFTDYLTQDMAQTWNTILMHSNQEERILLQEAYLRYCWKLTGKQVEWLNNNYSFLSFKTDHIGIAQCEKLLSNCYFTSLDSGNSELLDLVIKLSCYKINKPNLCVILNHLDKEDFITARRISLTRITNTRNVKFINNIRRNFAEAFDCLSLDIKDETKENIIYILNSNDISVEQKIKYLTGQHPFNDFSELDERNWTIAIQAQLISPTWQNVSAYSHHIKGVDDKLISYIEHYHTALESPSGDIENKESWFKQLLGTKKLSIPAFQSICKAFDNIFDGYEELNTMDSERLKILLNDNKIAFSEANIEIIKNTDIYADYLIHFAKDFIVNLEYAYDLDSETVLTLMKSNVFTASEKYSVMKIIDEKIISESPQLAELIIENVLAANNTSIIQDKVITLLKIAKEERLKVYFVELLLSEKTLNDKEKDFYIFLLLVSLGGIYKEIAERQKHPVLPRTDWNIALLNRLQDLDYISSISDVKDGIRVYPKRK